MQIIFDTNSLLIIFGILFCFVLHLFIWLPVYKIQKQLREHSFLLYKIRKYFDENYHTTQEIDEYTKQLHEGFTVLQAAYKKVYTEKRMPTPTEAQSIEMTIRDLLSTEIILSQDMRSPNSNSFKNVIMSVIRTYPDIDEEYLIKKTTSLFTQFIKDQ